MSSAQNHHQTIKKARNIQLTYKLTVNEYFHGTDVNFKYRKNKICQKCSGCGNLSGIQPKVCQKCDGKGFEIKLVNMSFFIQQSKVPCEDCNSSGFIIIDDDICTECNGKRVINTEVNNIIPIPAGIPVGTPLNFQEKGQEDFDHVPGDLEVIFKVEENKNWKVVNDGRLAYHMDISVLSLLYTDWTIIHHLNGSLIKIPLISVKNNQLMYEVEKFGIKRPNGEIDNLIIEVNLIFPELNDEEKIIIKRLDKNEEPEFLDNPKIQIAQIFEHKENENVQNILPQQCQTQ